MLSALLILSFDINKTIKVKPNKTNFEIFVYKQLIQVKPNMILVALQLKNKKTAPPSASQPLQPM